MALTSRKVYCYKTHADFRDDDGNSALMDTVINGNLVPAADRAEAAAYTDTYDNGVTKHYVKRDLRRGFFNPRTSDVSEHKIEQMGQKKWTFYEVNRDCMFHYLKWLQNGLEGELANARRAQQS